jgi:hypothetical protein
MKSILDPSFQYTASFNTDIQKTFARIRRDRPAVGYRTSPAITDALARISKGVRKAATSR